MICETCGETYYYDDYLLHTSSHKCPPRWDIRLDGDDDGLDIRKAFAHLPDTAAEDFVEANYGDLFDYPKHVELHLRPHDSDEPWQKFEVTVEMVPEFTAREVKE